MLSILAHSVHLSDDHTNPNSNTNANTNTNAYAYPNTNTFTDSFYGEQFSIATDCYANSNADDLRNCELHRHSNSVDHGNSAYNIAEHFLNSCKHTDCHSGLERIQLNEQHRVIRAVLVLFCCSDRC